MILRAFIALLLLGLVPSARPVVAATAASRVLVLDRASEQPSGGDADRIPVRHALGALGIAYDEVPFSVSAAALDPALYPAAVINSYLDEGDVPASVRLALEQYVTGGGTLLATKVGDASLQPLFGVVAETRTRNAFEIEFLSELDPELFARLDRPEERRIRIADPAHFDESYDSVAVYELEPGEAVGLATLYGKDGETVGTCMARRDVGSGRAYVLGLTYFTSVMRAEANRDAEAQRIYINGFEPGADVARLLLLGLIDRAVAGGTVRLYTQPGLFDTALLMTHDWDSEDSFYSGSWGDAIARAFAEQEARLDIPSLNFLTTKFFSDEQGPAFWRPQIPCDVAALARPVFGSHSVAHRVDFQDLPPGDRSATCADYDPDAPTINDEIRCSKERIEVDLPVCLGQPMAEPVDAFRAGFLLFPTELPQELEAAGYRLDSTRSAPDVLTYFPFRLMEDSLWHVETEVLELPVAADDVDLGPGDPLHVVHAWRETMKAVAGNGPPFVLLIHPTRGLEPYGTPPEEPAPINPDADFKLQAEARIVRFARDHGWPVLESRWWAEWWREREEIAIERAVFDDGSGLYEVDLRNNGPGAANDVSLEFGLPIRLVSLETAGEPATQVACRRVWIERIEAGETVALTASVDPADEDGDGIADGCDNCVSLPNPAQADFDGDGFGDACEPTGDIDNSGRVDGYDLVLLAGSFAAVEVQGHYHDGSDLTRDGLVDGDDLAILAGVFGSTP